MDRSITGLIGVAACLLRLALPSPLPAQERPDTNDERYRWSAKVDTALATRPVIPTSVTGMLAWTPANWDRHDDAAARAGLELHVYRLSGWIRRVRQNEDGDVHLSLTATPDGSSDSCVVAEIPAVRYGAVYERARADLLALLQTSKIKRSGRLAQPVAVVVTGAAFFDGKHLERGKKHGKRAERGPHAEGHGDCNASASALWEIHPVYRIGRP